METSVPRPSSSENQRSGSAESPQATGEARSSVNPSTQQHAAEMEFAQMPSHHHYGPYGNSTAMYDMSEISGSLPQYNHPQYTTQFMPQVTQASAIHHNLAYASIANQQWVPQGAGQYAQQYHQHMQPAFTGYDMNLTNPNVDMHARSHVHPQQQVPYAINVGHQPHYQTYQTQFGPYVSPQMAQYEHRPNMPYQVARAQMEQHSSTSGIVRRENLDSRRDSSTSTLQVSTTLRGPPRKAKQSGHALWVGNLPPGTNIVELKDHLARDATDDIQSVFLIAKTNCAFVNYKTAESCAAAMMRFHDSRFRQMRLVCRLRRGSSPNAATEYSQNEVKDAAQSTDAEFTNTTQASSIDDSALAIHAKIAGRLVQDKFFIIKSLTREDVDRAVATGTWATQAQNEENLNLAFATAENVYLIFSVNKSSEYYGYARMESAISGDIPVVREAVLPSISVPTVSDGPTIIPTPATETAPRGYIVDDSARGNIFWEAELDSSSPLMLSAGSSINPGDTSGDESAPEPTPQPSNVGRPFKINWKSTEKLPFIRTRGLRNPWNSNREIKIARDGTEVEPTIGRRLISMFDHQALTGENVLRHQNMSQLPQLPTHSTYPGMMPHGGYAYGTPMPNVPPYGRPY